MIEFFIALYIVGFVLFVGSGLGIWFSYQGEPGNAEYVAKAKFGVRLAALSVVWPLFVLVKIPALVRFVVWGFSK